jgi:hypothetical protein
MNRERRKMKLNQLPLHLLLLQHVSFPSFIYLFSHSLPSFFFILSDTNIANASNASQGSLLDNETIANTWSSITWGATSLWSKATEVTTDLIQNIQKEPGDEDLRFPRPPDASSNKNANEAKPPLPTSAARNNSFSNNNNNNNNSNNNNNNYNNREDESNDTSTRSIRPLSSNNSWDTMSDVLKDSSNGSSTRSKQGTGNNDFFNQSFSEMNVNNTRASGGAGSPITKAKGETSRTSTPVLLSRNSSGLSLNAEHNNSNSALPVRSTPPTSGNSGVAIKPTGTGAKPAGDDFFSTFGV